MADLAADTVGTVQQTSVDDDAAADTGAQGDKDGTAAAHAAALPEFAQGGAIGVVAGLDAQAGQTAQSLMEVENAPVEIDAAVDQAVVADRPRHTDAYASDVVFPNVPCVQNVLDRRSNVRQDCLTAVFRAAGDLLPLQKHARFVKQAQFYRCSSHIRAKAVFHIPFLLFCFPLYTLCIRISTQTFFHLGLCFRRI